MIEFGLRPLTQAASARINGSKSRGPITASGKRRSSRNALRHGLLSKRIAPLNNDRGERQDFDHQLRELLREFKPRTRTEQNLVESLARDWVRYGRIGSHIEHLMTPQMDVDRKPWMSVHDETRRLRRARGALRHLNAGEPFALGKLALRQLSNDIVEFIEDLADAARNQTRRRREGHDPEDFADEADMARSFRQIRPRKLGLHRQEHVDQVLSDATPIARNEVTAWQVLLKQLVAAAQGRLTAAQRDEELHEQACRRQFGHHTSNGDDLKLWGEYERQCRRAIEKTTLMLLNLQQPRRRWVRLWKTHSALNEHAAA